MPSYAPLGQASEWYLQYLLAGQPKFAEFQKKNYGNNATVESYKEFAKDFHAELWDPDQWMELFDQAGAKGIMFTTKHCDGYTHWKSPSKPGYNSIDTGPKRDILGDLSTAVRAKDMRLGFYYCDCEWGNPVLATAEGNGWVGGGRDPGKATVAAQQKYADLTWFPDMKHLTETYEPDMYFPDFGSACGFNSTTLRSREFVTWLYNDSPVKDKVVMGDRLGSDVSCKHGDYFTCQDRFQPQ